MVFLSILHYKRGIYTIAGFFCLFVYFSPDNSPNLLSENLRRVDFFFPSPTTQIKYRHIGNGFGTLFSHSVVSTLCDPINCSMSGLPVLHYISEMVKLISIESMMPSNHLILCRPLLLLPSFFPSIRIFCNESALCIRCPK